MQRGDFVLTTRGTVGNIAFYDKSIPFENMRINSGMVILRNGTDFDSKYLFQLLKSLVIKNQIIELTTGSAQPQLPIRDINFLKLVKPPLREQCRIAEILSSLDDKIELNRKINANLEKLASTLFKKWFVDIGDKLPEGWRMELMTGYAATRTSASSTDNASDSAAEVSLLEKTAHSREWAFFFFVVQYVRKSINFNQSKSCGTTIIQCSVRRSGVRSAGAYLAQSFF